MEDKLKIKNKKFLTVTVLTLFLLSATAISNVSASAELDPTRIPDQTPTDASSELVSENPTLYAVQDNNTSATDDNSILDRAPDNSTVSADDSTLYTSQNSESNNQNLIAVQAQPDLAIIIVLVACVGVIASLAIFVSRRQTKNSK